MSQKKKASSLRITLAIFVGLILGIIFGLLMPGRFDWMQPVITLITNLYMNALRMMIYPLVFCSLIVGIKGIGSVSATGKIGGQSVLYYVITYDFGRKPDRSVFAEGTGAGTGCQDRDDRV